MSWLVMRCGTERASIAGSFVVGLFAVGLTACGMYPHGEWTAAQCRDGLDNDHDGLIDCDDPDCWAFACASEPPASKDAGTDAGHSAGDASAEEPRDASITKPPPVVMDDDSGPMMSVPDASVPPPSCTNHEIDCPTNASCVAGVCKPNGIAGNYRISILSAVVPERSLTGACYDFSLACQTLFQPCTNCQPDPFVTIMKNGVTTVGTTSHQNNTQQPMWKDAVFKLTLTASDRLEFVVWQYDPVLLPLRIFSCVPDLAEVSTGTLRCNPSLGMTIEPGSAGAYDVIASITRVP